MTTYKDDTNIAALTLPNIELLSGKNILVVGATGLIGGCVVDVLMARKDIDFHLYAAGRNKVRATKRFADYARSAHFHFIEMDVIQPLNTDINFHFIIDAASGATPAQYKNSPVNVIKANIWGVDNLLTYGKMHGMEKFVYVSSGEIYGEGIGNKFTEDYSGYVNCATARACYPSSKRAAETLCVSYASQFGLNISVARPSHVYGPRFTEKDDRVYAQFINNVINGEDITLHSAGTQFRSWCYVVDCATALLYIMLKGGNMEAYNVADDSSNVSIKELARLIADVAGKKVITDIPQNTDQKTIPPITKATFDTSKLKRLGWRISGDISRKLNATIAEQRAYINDFQS